MNQVQPANQTRDILYTIPQIAKLTRETDRVWYQRCDKGLLPHLRIGRSIRVRKSAFDAFIAACERPVKESK